MVEIIPKPTTELPFWQKILFYISISLFLVSFLAFFVLNHFHQKAELQLKQLEEILSEERSSEEITLEKKVFDYQKRIRDFSKISRSHIFPSNFFIFFEKLCHPRIWFSKLSLNFKDFSLAVSGEAESFSDLGQQILIFRQEEKIKKADLTEIAIGPEGKINFSINISFNSEILK